MPDSIIKADNISSLSGGGVGFPDGSVSNPSLKFTNDSDTGLYRIGNNTIGIASNGARVGEIGNGYGGFTGNVIQVVSGQLTTSTTTTSTSFVDTGLSATITPKYLTSQILILAMGHGGGNTNALFLYNLVRNSVNIAQSTGGNAANQTGSIFDNGTDQNVSAVNITFLDSPNTTSSTIYKVQFRSNNGVVVSFNRRSTGNDFPGYSSIILLEIQQ